METIRMVDLYGQYLKIKDEIDNAIFSVIERSSFVKGNEVTDFEKQLAQYLRIPYVISCANGTDALQIALMAIDLQPGDEVITSTFTFIATAEVIALLKLKPVLVDVDPETFLIDISQIKSKITNKTKAIIPVHLFGQCCEMNSIMEIAQQYNLFVIEDTAQALGADYYSNNNAIKAGTIGHIGCTSFFPSKNLGCFGDGGALFSHNEQLSQKIRSIANHGMTQRYYHDHIGVNSRLDSMQAAILSVKLKYLDQYHQQRQQAASYYDSELSNIPWLKIPKRVTWSSHIFHQYSILLDNKTIRDALKQYLEQHKIPTMVYYPVPIHRQKAYASYQFNDNEFPVANKLCETILSLPMHTELTNQQLHYICNTIKQFKP
ncbi:MAG: DegT/DnrJ/EryC1/StrS family aminotransferase [Bacteroidales bacterium]|nr:DegT/DnrJ/EryC1/StrS family aminotransferase [Bacteroidales bacterium]